MFGFLSKDIDKIDTLKTFLRCIKSLRKLNIPVPITEGYEETLRNKGQHPKNLVHFTR